MTLWPWPNIKWLDSSWTIPVASLVIVYSFSRFGSIARRHTDALSCTHRQTWMNAWLPRLSSAWAGTGSVNSLNRLSYSFNKNYNKTCSYIHRVPKWVHATKLRAVTSSNLNGFSKLPSTSLSSPPPRLMRNACINNRLMLYSCKINCRIALVTKLIASLMVFRFFFHRYLYK